MLKLVPTERDEHAATCRCPRCEKPARPLWSIDLLNTVIWVSGGLLTITVWGLAYIGLQAVLS